LIQKPRTKKKGRVMKVTRPEPKIYGNCDSWSFIVGKKPRTYRRHGHRRGSLQASNKKVIHNLSTKSGGKCWDNMWAICGSPVDCAYCFRMMVGPAGDMHTMAILDRRFYRKTSQAPLKVSSRQLLAGSPVAKNIFPARLF